MLAAGAARRYGSAKQLAALDGVSLVRRAAQAALAAGLSPTVVTGAYAEAVAAELRDLRVPTLHNADWEQGLGSSIACGFRSLLTESSPPAAAAICLADQALVGAAQLRQLVAAHRAAPLRIVAARYAGVRGPPCLFPRRWYGELARLSGDRGARALLERYAAEVIEVAMPEAATDMDTPADYEALVARKR